MFADRTNWNLAPNRLSEAVTRHRASGKPLLDLTASNPTQCGFHYDERILGALRNPSVLKYEPDPKGLRVARLSVAEYYSDLGAKLFSEEDIFLTTSTSEAYSFVFRLICNPKDEILVPVPSYPLFSFLADILDVKLVHYPLLYDHGWQIDFHSLQQAVTSRTRGIIMVNPNNPTGHFVRPADLESLNGICSKDNLALIVDEVFLDFAIAQAAEVSSRTLAGNEDALTFVMSGLSKISGLPQMKLAWLVASGAIEMRRQALNRLEMISDTFLSPSAPVQLATPFFLETRRPFQHQVLLRVRSNLAELDRQLRGQAICSRLHVEGGWYAILRVPATHPDEELALRLLNGAGVYVHPGQFFGFSRDGYLVISLITKQDEFADGLQRLLAYVTTA